MMRHGFVRGTAASAVAVVCFAAAVPAWALTAAAPSTGARVVAADDEEPAAGDDPKVLYVPAEFKGRITTAQQTKLGRVLSAELLALEGYSVVMYADLPDVVGSARKAKAVEGCKFDARCLAEKAKGAGLAFAASARFDAGSDGKVRARARVIDLRSADGKTLSSAEETFKSVDDAAKSKNLRKLLQRVFGDREALIAGRAVEAESEGGDEQAAEEEPAPRRGGRGGRAERGPPRPTAAELTAGMAGAYRKYLTGDFDGAVADLDALGKTPCRCPADDKVIALRRDVNAVREGLGDARRAAERANGTAILQGALRARETVDHLRGVGQGLGVAGEASAGEELRSLLAEGHYLSGVGDAKRKEYLKAIDAWKQALAIDANHPGAKKELANLESLAQKLFSEAQLNRYVEPQLTKRNLETILKIYSEEGQSWHDKAADLLDEMREAGEL